NLKLHVAGFECGDGQVFRTKVRHEVAETIYAEDNTFQSALRGFRFGHSKFLMVGDFVAHGSGLRSFGQPSSDRGENVATVEGLADRLEVIVFDVGVANDQTFLPFVNERKHSVVGRNKILGFAGNKQRSTSGAYARVNDNDVDRAGRKVRIGRANSERAVEQVVGCNVVRDVNDVGFRIDFQDDALECANEVIVSAVVSRERNDWLGHRSSAFKKIETTTKK